MQNAVRLLQYLDNFGFSGTYFIFNNSKPILLFDK